MFKNKLVCLIRNTICLYSFFYCPESFVDPILVIQALFFSHLMAIVKNNGTVAIA